MSDSLLEDTAVLVLIGFISIIAGILIGSSVFDDSRIDKVIKAQKDCLIKEYYYLNEHRYFCDKIGVSP